MDLLKPSLLHLRPLSLIDLNGTGLHGVEIRREGRYIDLMITCQQSPFAVVIENKVRSHGHSQQLGRYQDVMLEQFSKLRHLYVYLTPNGEAPSDETWMPCSWIVLRFEVFFETEKLDYYVEVWRMAELVKRREIVEKLIEDVQKFGFNTVVVKLKIITLGFLVANAF